MEMPDGDSNTSLECLGQFNSPRNVLAFILFLFVLTYQRTSTVAPAPARKSGESRFEQIQQETKIKELTAERDELKVYKLLFCLVAYNIIYLCLFRNREFQMAQSIYFETNLRFSFITLP